MAKNKANAKSVPIRFKFNKIELLSSSISLPLGFKIDDAKNMKFKVELKYRNDHVNPISITLTFSLYYKEDLAFTFSTNTVCGVMETDIKNLNNPNDEKKFAQSLVELAVNQSRGIQSQIFIGEPIHGLLYIPILKGNELIKNADFISTPV